MRDSHTQTQTHTTKERNREESSLLRVWLVCGLDQTLIFLPSWSHSHSSSTVPEQWAGCENTLSSSSFQPSPAFDAGTLEQAGPAIEFQGLGRISTPLSLILCLLLSHLLSLHSLNPVTLSSLSLQVASKPACI